MVNGKHEWRNHATWISKRNTLILHPGVIIQFSIPHGTHEAWNHTSWDSRTWTTDLVQSILTFHKFETSERRCFPVMLVAVNQMPHVDVCVCKYVCIYIYIHTKIYNCTYVYMYLYIYILCICMCIYKYILW